MIDVLYYFEAPLSMHVLPPISIIMLREHSSMQEGTLNEDPDAASCSGEHTTPRHHGVSSGI